MGREAVDKGKIFSHWNFPQNFHFISGGKRGKLIIRRQIANEKVGE
jgi:hypothetical protein